jgi:hypothetical protein
MEMDGHTELLKNIIKTNPAISRRSYALCPCRLYFRTRPKPKNQI